MSIVECKLGAVQALLLHDPYNPGRINIDKVWCVWNPVKVYSFSR